VLVAVEVVALGAAVVVPVVVAAGALDPEVVVPVVVVVVVEVALGAAEIVAGVGALEAWASKNDVTFSVLVHGWL
jgi:hypothetical protein